MVVSNPRESVLWTPRTQEMMGGWNPREVLDHDINPNEDSDGLSHHGRETPEDGMSRDQADPKKRRERALRELATKIPHISIKPEKIDDTLGRSPQFEQEQTMLEAGVGLDLNRNGIGLSSGMNAGSVRSEGSNIKYGGSNTLVPAMLGKAIKDGKCTGCGTPVMGLPDTEDFFCIICMHGDRLKRKPKAIRFKPFDEVDMNSKDDGFGDTSNIDYFTASEDLFEQSWDSISKARRKYKGRRYSDDEESAEDERKAKAKNKRKRKREGKRGKKTARGGRQIKSATKRRAGSVQLQVDRGSKRQAFHPNAHSEAIKRIGSARAEGIPLRLRDPVAWERKKAYERMRRQQGSLPTGLTHHADTRGVGTKNRGIIGGASMAGTKLPAVSRMGTSTRRFSRNAVGDPLSTHDPLLAKAKSPVSRAEIMSMKRKIERLLEKLNKLTKQTPELNDNAKIRAQPSDETASAPTGATELNEEDKPYRAFVDMSMVGGKK